MCKDPLVERARACQGPQETKVYGTETQRGSQYGKTKVERSAAGGKRYRALELH